MKIAPAGRSLPRFGAIARAVAVVGLNTLLTPAAISGTHPVVAGIGATQPFSPARVNEGGQSAIIAMSPIWRSPGPAQRPA